VPGGTAVARKNGSITEIYQRYKLSNKKYAVVVVVVVAVVVVSITILFIITYK